MRQILCPILQVETLGTRNKHISLGNTRLMQWTRALEAYEAKQQNTASVFQEHW